METKPKVEGTRRIVFVVVQIMILISVFSAVAGKVISKVKNIDEDDSEDEVHTVMYSVRSTQGLHIQLWPVRQSNGLSEIVCWRNQR